MLRKREEGFTLIELMIVIAIIGVLAAIAIPNFISYRNKSFCAQVEGDAKSVVAALSSYFSNPARTALPTLAQLKSSGEKIAIDSTMSITGDVNNVITIAATKAAGNKCPRGSVFTTYMGTTQKGTWSGTP